MQMGVRLLGALVMTALGAAPAWGQSSRLWSERSDGSPPLAQVPDFKSLAKQVVPAVVSIQVEQRIQTGTGSADPFHEFFFRFWGEMPREFHGRGIGTGFVIRKDGLILTNNHVIENADSIEVTFALADGSEKKLLATVVGRAPKYDVALIKTNEDAQAAYCYLGDSDRIDIGDWVMAVGNPFGLSHSVSVGIISAKGRRDINPSGRRGLYDFIQTDASINPGNSGGPLIGMKGEVVGINTAINAAGSGIGFAIPINMVKAMLPDLQEKGHFVRSWIGIKIQPLNAELAQSYGLSKPEGALVSEVVSGGPADAAGLREGDIILRFDGKEVRESSDLPLYASMAGVNKKVSLAIWRDRREVDKHVVLEEYPEDSPVVASGETPSGGALGITVHDITPDLQRQFRLEKSRGVVLKDVETGSVAHRAGMRAGDVVVGLNGDTIKSAREFAGRVRKIKSGGVLRLKIQRQGGKIFLALRKP